VLEEYLLEILYESGNRMPPPAINVEEEFTRFVSTFRGGGCLMAFVAEVPPGSLNADYYFPDDNVIAELKTLEVDALDAETLGRRIMGAYIWLGYQLHDYVDFLLGRKYMPDDVNRRVISTISRPIIECIKKANKQIISSRILLNKPDARGLILIANSGNFIFNLNQITSTILNGFERLSKKERDAIVYFTPNVHYDIGDGIPYELWIPIANELGNDMQEFVDLLGKAWFDYNEANGRESLVRKSGSDFLPLLGAKAVKGRSD